MILILVHCYDLSVFKVSCLVSIYFNLVAFCPAVNFLRGISSGGRFVSGILCCGILSRGILSVHHWTHRIFSGFYPQLHSLCDSCTKENGV